VRCLSEYDTFKFFVFLWQEETLLYQSAVRRARFCATTHENKGPRDNANKTHCHRYCEHFISINDDTFPASWRWKHANMRPYTSERRGNDRKKVGLCQRRRHWNCCWNCFRWREEI